MCLPDFEGFDNIREDNPLIGYRTWRFRIKGGEYLQSRQMDYVWKQVTEGPHAVGEFNSGIYGYNSNYKNNYTNCYNSNYNNSYNNNYTNCYNNNYNYCYNNYYNKYYNNYNNNSYSNYYYNYYDYYYHNGIIRQYGRVAIHKVGQRSEYAEVQTLFTIRESDARGDNTFIDWIKEFNQRVRQLAEFYKAGTQDWQDFLEENQK
jgi:hypothetical protein